MKGMRLMNPKRFRYLCVVMVVSLVLLNGCTTPVALTPTFPSVTPILITDMPTSSPVPPTRTPLPTPTRKPPTPKPPTPTVTPSPTVAPTLTADQEQALVLDLLQNNAGCQLPCWWGFTPGKTSWQTAQTFFTLLGKMPGEYRGPGMLNYTVDFRIPRHDVQIGQVYIIRDGLIEAIWIGASTVRNHERVYGDKQFAKDWRRYFLPQLLTTYGQPTEVLLRTFRGVPEGSFVPFNLLLFYPQQGFLVWYYGPTELKGERIRMCPEQTEIALWLWPPDQKMTLEDIARWGQGFSIEEVSGYHSLEKATGLSPETFYKIFRDASNQACLETPVDMWP